MVEDLNTHFIKEENQMPEKHKIVSAPLLIKEIQIKTTMKYGLLRSYDI